MSSDPQLARDLNEGARRYFLQPQRFGVYTHESGTEDMDVVIELAPGYVLDTQTSSVDSLFNRWLSTLEVKKPLRSGTSWSLYQRIWYDFLLFMS